MIKALGQETDQCSVAQIFRDVLMRTS